MIPYVSQLVLYRTDGRNGLVYDLPAIVTVTKESHPGDYPNGATNPLPVPESNTHVHLTVFTPGGYGSFLPKRSRHSKAQIRRHDSAEFVGAEEFVPGSGTYVEWNVPLNKPQNRDNPAPRTWRIPS
jgi:hypothetical protein